MGVIQADRGIGKPILNRLVVAEGDSVFREGTPGDTA